MIFHDKLRHNYNKINEFIRNEEQNNFSVKKVSLRHDLIIYKIMKEEYCKIAIHEELFPLIANFIKTEEKVLLDLAKSINELNDRESECYSIDRVVGTNKLIITPN